MKIKEITGIDVSKLTLDVRLHLTKVSSRFDNTPEGIRALVKWAERSSGVKREALFFVFEHTGLYSYQLLTELSRLGVCYSVESGLAVKRSLGITRGKDDKIDARKLALYGYRLREELTPYRLPEQQLRELQSLLRLRDRLVRQRAGYKVSLAEEKRVLDSREYQLLFDIQKKVIVELSIHIKQLESRFQAIIKSHSRLKKLYKLITSVKGIGPETALHFIVFTHGCTRFKTWRAFAAYAGTAPFTHRSGSSIRGKNRVSHLANKKIKSLLDMCAKSAIQHDKQLKAYYQRKLKEKKQEMCVINAVRNKLLARIFAVVERETPYVEIHKFAA